MHNVDVYKSLADGAYQGAPGAYSEEAAQLLLGKDARLMPCATLEQAFDAITDGRVTHAVVPVENAVSGTVPLVYELLLANDLVVAGETSINIDYLLVARPRHPLLARRGLHLRQILQYPLVLAEAAGYSRRRLEEALHRHALAPRLKLAVETSSDDYTLSCVRAGLGVGITVGTGRGAFYQLK